MVTIQSEIWEKVDEQRPSRCHSSIGVKYPSGLVILSADRYPQKKKEGSYSDSVDLKITT